MHDVYRHGGSEKQMAPHVIYSESKCPHDDCDHPLQAIDFRPKDYGRTIHDPLVKAWWEDSGFAGQCPKCGGWIHFTIREKKALSAEQAGNYLHLPDDWADNALIL